MTGEKVLSAEGWTKAHQLRVRGSCEVCALPPEVLRELEWLYEKGYRSRHMTAYLEEGGYTIRQSLVENHYRRGHNR